MLLPVVQLRFARALCLLGLAGAFTASAQRALTVPTGPSAYSTSAPGGPYTDTNPDPATPAAGAAVSTFAAPGSATNPRGNFLAMGIAFTAGASGLGGQFAIATSHRTNLRFSGNAFSYARTIYADGITYTGDLDFRSATANLDYFFYKGLRISPGVTLYNGNNIHASASVPAGQVFFLNGNAYRSSPTDPIHGTGALSFGSRTAPNLTIGVGNIIPRSGRHFSVPLEIGAQYISQMHVSLALQGTACNDFGCSSASADPTIQANIKSEQDELNHDLQPFRFYPILSLGVGYRF